MIALQNPDTAGSMFVPIVMGSDKTTVSVATGQNDYWPLYASIGNVHNNIRRAHGNGLVLVAFLANPKSLFLIYCLNGRKLTALILLADKANSETAEFRQFRRQLYHSSLSFIFSSLKPGMMIPEVVQCPDHHFRHVLWGLAPYIADYQEQLIVACIVQYWCARYVIDSDCSYTIISYSISFTGVEHYRIILMAQNHLIDVHAHTLIFS
jgi:hypothetical protein